MIAPVLPGEHFDHDGYAERAVPLAPGTIRKLLAHPLLSREDERALAERMLLLKNRPDMREEWLKCRNTLVLSFSRMAACEVRVSGRIGEDFDCGMSDAIQILLDFVSQLKTLHPRFRLSTYAAAVLRAKLRKGDSRGEFRIKSAVRWARRMSNDGLANIADQRTSDEDDRADRLANQRRMVEDGLERLPPGEAAVLSEHVLGEGAPLKRIARRTNVPSSTLSCRILSAVRRLRIHFGIDAPTGSERRHAREDKALALIESVGPNVKRIAKAMGVSEGSVYRWPKVVEAIRNARKENVTHEDLAIALLDEIGPNVTLIAKRIGVGARTLYRWPSFIREVKQRRIGEAKRTSR